MITMFGYKLISDWKYKRLMENQRINEEALLIAERTRIGKNKKLFTRRYKKYFGRWYIAEDGSVCRIKGIRYRPNAYTWADQFEFEAYVPNIEDWYDIPISDIVDGKLEEVSKKEAIKNLVGSE